MTNREIDYYLKQQHAKKRCQNEKELVGVNVYKLEELDSSVIHCCNFPGNVETWMLSKGCRSGL